MTVIIGPVTAGAQANQLSPDMLDSLQVVCNPRINAA